MASTKFDTERVQLPQLLTFHRDHAFFLERPAGKLKQKDGLDWSWGVFGSDVVGWSVRLMLQCLYAVFKRKK